MYMLVCICICKFIVCVCVFYASLTPCSASLGLRRMAAIDGTLTSARGRSRDIMGIWLEKSIYFMYIDIRYKYIINMYIYMYIQISSTTLSWVPVVTIRSCLSTVLFRFVSHISMFCYGPSGVFLGKKRLKSLTKIMAGLDHPIRLVPKESRCWCIAKSVVENLFCHVGYHCHVFALKNWRSAWWKKNKMIFDRSILRKCISVG